MDQASTTTAYTILKSIKAQQIIKYRFFTIKRKLNNILKQISIIRNKMENQQKLNKNFIFYF